MKYAVIGSAISGNKGAASMLESAIQTIEKRDKNASFVLLSMYPDSDKRLNKRLNLEIVNAKPLYLGIVINPLSLMHLIFPPLRRLVELNKSVKELYSSDVLIDQAGVSFVDGREKFLIYNIASLLPALFLRVPVFKSAQAMGPFKSIFNRVVAKTFLPFMHTVVSRGNKTDRYLKNIGLNNVFTGADYAFSMNITQEDRETAKKMADIKGGWVAVCPSAVLEGKNTVPKHSDEIKKIIDHLLDKNYKILLLPHSARANTNKIHNNDLPLVEKIAQGFKGNNKVMSVNKELEPGVLRALIAKCEFVVASRFHAMVSALSVGVPPLVFGWSHKYKEVLDMFEVGEVALDSSKSSLNKKILYLDQFIENRKKYADSIDANLKHVVKLSQKQADLIVKTAKE